MATLTIRVQKEDGSPIPGVEVELWENGACSGSPSRGLTTKSNGMATFYALDINSTVGYKVKTISGYQQDTCHSRLIWADEETLTLTLYSEMFLPASFDITNFSVGKSSAGGMSNLSTEKYESVWLVGNIRNVGGTSGTVGFGLYKDGIRFYNGSMTLSPNDTGTFRKEISIPESGLYNYCVKLN